MSENSSSTTFCVPRKMFLWLYFINWLDFIVWLPFFLEILDNTCIAIVYFPCCDVISFEINLIFLMKHFSIWPKIQDKNLNVLRTKKYFKVEEKVFFIIFKGLSVAENCVRPESALLISGYFINANISNPRKLHALLIPWNKVALLNFYRIEIGWLCSEYAYDF